MVMEEEIEETEETASMENQEGRAVFRARKKILTIITILQEFHIPAAKRHHGHTPCVMEMENVEVKMIANVTIDIGAHAVGIVEESSCALANIHGMKTHVVTMVFANSQNKMNFLVVVTMIVTETVVTVVMEEEMGTVVEEEVEEIITVVVMEVDTIMVTKR